MTFLLKKNKCFLKQLFKTRNWQKKKKIKKFKQKETDLLMKKILLK
jgi:hypothetical protein